MNVHRFLPERLKPQCLNGQNRDTLLVWNVLFWESSVAAKINVKNLAPVCKANLQPSSFKLVNQILPLVGRKMTSPHLLIPEPLSSDG